MKLEFDYLDIKHFKTFEGASIDFSEQGNGLHFVRGLNRLEPRLGSNGAAKSSLFAALCWCLYGRTADELKNPDIVPWQGKGKPFVETGILVDGKKHYITRTANPNSFKINDKDAGPEEVVNLIGLDFEVFRHTILLAQGQPLFLDLEPRNKIQLFTELLALDRWDDRSSAAATEFMRNEKEVMQLQGELSTLERQTDQLASLLASSRKMSEEWEKDRQARLGKYKAEHKELTAKEAPLIKQLEALELQADEAGVAFKLARKDLDKLSSEMENLRTQQVRLEGRRDGMRNRFEDLTEERDKTNEGKCPTCGQTLKGANAEKHRKRIDADLKTLGENIDGIGSELREGKSKLTKMTKTREKFVNEVAESEKRVSAARNGIDVLMPNLQAMRVKRTELAKQIREWEEEGNPHQDQVSKLRREHQKTDKARATAEAEWKDYQSRLESLKFWVKGFKDVRLYVIEEVLRELEMTTDAYLESVGLLDWQIRYDVERETKSGTVRHGLDVSILSPSNKKPVKWNSWSGGESQRLRLVSALALSEVLLNHAGVETTFEVLDEPTRHLSDEGVRDLCEFLSERARLMGRQTWLIDHKAMESAQFSSVLTVIKGQDGHSRLKW